MTACHQWLVTPDTATNTVPWEHAIMKMEVSSCIYIVNDDTVNIGVINKPWPDDLIGEQLYIVL